MNPRHALLAIACLPLAATAAETWRCPDGNGGFKYQMKACPGGVALDPDRDAIKERLDMSIRERDAAMSRVRQEIERKANIAATAPWGNSPTKARTCPRLVEDMQRQVAGLDASSQTSVNTTFADLQIAIRRWSEFACDFP